MKATKGVENGDARVTVDCPCCAYRDVKTIYHALRSPEKTQQVVEWLSEKHTLDGGNRQPTCRSSSSSNSRCVARVSASFSILNDIRNACREYLESSAEEKPVESYETAFPSFSSTVVNVFNDANAVNQTPNTLVARTKPKQTKNASLAGAPAPSRRRIRPAQASPSTNGNISSIPSEDHFPLPGPPKIPGTNAVQSTRGTPTTSDVNVSRTTSFEPATTSNVWSGSTGTKAWSQQASDIRKDNQSTKLSNHGNIGSLNSEEPLSSWTKFPKKVTVMQDYDGPPPGRLVAPVVAASPPRRSAYQMPSMPSMPTRSFDSPRTTKHTVDASDPFQPTLELNSIHIENTARLYTTLILYQLVPSTPLELHLLIGLLTVKDGASRSTEPHLLRNILVSPKACREFAAKSLMNLNIVLGNMPIQILEALIDCPPVRELMPGLVNELSVRLNERRIALVDTDTGFGGGTQPILALPFDQARDSRHNYKSQAESTLYKNREESRDAFLYQLRNFQNVRGRVLDTSQLDTELLKIRQAARNVIQGVQTPNMHWFAQFFSDLLLQIGLVPMEETDKEVLSITNKDKLQKLHKRFSSKVGPSKGSSTKMLSDTRDGQSPEIEAHHFFPGHQEFFFLFIQASDSYRFGLHLKSRLAAVVESLGGQRELKGLQDRLLKLQLVGKFLGVLLFSQNWHKSTLSSVLGSASRSEIQVWTNTTGSSLPLLEWIKIAHREHRLVDTVPWILELLRMAKWDSLSLRADHLEEILATLVSVQNFIRKSSGPSLQFVSLCIESFFHQVVGLGRVHSMPLVSVSDASPVGNNSLDSTDLRVSNCFLFGSVSHMDEFVALLTSIASTRSKTVGTPRKMRPLMVSVALSSFSSMPSLEDSMPVLPHLHETKRSGAADSKSRIISKLVDMFFHQHRQLKEICEFVADHAIRKATIEMQHTFLPNHLPPDIYLPADGGEATISEDIEREAVVQALKFFQDSLGSATLQSIRSLSPSSENPKVIDIAAKLATNHAIKQAEPQIRSMVKTHMQKCLQVYHAHLRKENRQQEKGSITEFEIG